MLFLVKVVKQKTIKLEYLSDPSPLHKKKMQNISPYTYPNQLAHTEHKLFQFAGSAIFSLQKMPYFVVPPAVWHFLQSQNQRNVSVILKTISTAPCRRNWQRFSTGKIESAQIKTTYSGNYHSSPLALAPSSTLTAQSHLCSHPRCLSTLRSKDRCVHTEKWKLILVIILKRNVVVWF